MKSILLGALLIAVQFAVGQSRGPSPNETPTGRSVDTPKTPEHSASEHVSEAAHGESTHGAAGTAEQGSEHARSAVQHGEGEAEHAMPNEIWWKFANFVILVGGLGYLLAKNAGPFFRARTASIQQGITEAAQVKAEAEARAKEIETRVTHLSADVHTMKQQSREEMAAENARLQAETERQLAKIHSQAQAEIASAAKLASAELQAFSAQLALELAETQIQARMNPELQHALADAFVQDLRSKPGANGNGAVQ